MYTDTIRKWAADTRYVGTLENPSGVGEVGLGPEQAGRQVAVRFALRLKRQRVESVRYQVYGCGYSIAACAAAADLAVNHPLGEVRQITAGQIDNALKGLPDDRKYCADLALKALKAALHSITTQEVVQESVAPVSAEDHGPRIDASNPLYRRLMNSPGPADVVTEDRHLVACCLAVAETEGDFGRALGLKETDLRRLVRRVFPRADHSFLRTGKVAPDLPKADPDTRALLLSHVPRKTDSPLPRLLALILATRSAHPGHLWVAMGFFSRPELTAAIERHLPSLARANSGKMRWKRFFAKQICDANGGLLCKAPTCGECPERDECFPPDEGVYQ